MFENPQIVERFLDYWRVTGHQRIGFLYGTYEIHTDVPLGIRATVSAIYEPPQVFCAMFYLKMNHSFHSQNFLKF